MLKVKIDSRKVMPGDTFVALKGSNVDGHDFIEQAIENGATKIVANHLVTCNAEVEVVGDTLTWLLNHIKENYASVINEMNLIGITGTNGKTTTAYLTYQLLNNLGSKTAYIGTIGYYVTGEDVIELPNTTPDIVELYNLLLDAKEKGCQNVVMEVSSHALEQKRVYGLEFQTAAFTNLTQDHLDYHLTMDNYLNAKLLLLKQLKGKVVINADDAYASKWVQNSKQNVLLGKNGSDLRIVNYYDTLNGTKIVFNYADADYEVETNLKSEFNVYNYLTALSLIHNLGYEIDKIISVTQNIYAPKGRCEQIQVNGGLAVIDYAHTPDAVEKIIKAFSVNKTGKIITIIGCGGDRDNKKRPIMGNIASENSDYVIFTSDNPRTEDPQKIMADIVAGVSKENYEIEYDRKIAISKALDMVKANDIVLILGKGHEDYQIIGHEKNHLDDAEEVRKYLEK